MSLSFWKTMSGFTIPGLHPSYRSCPSAVLVQPIGVSCEEGKLWPVHHFVSLNDFDSRPCMMITRLESFLLFLSDLATMILKVIVCMNMCQECLCEAGGFRRRIWSWIAGWVAWGEET